MTPRIIGFAADKDSLGPGECWVKWYQIDILRTRTWMIPPKDWKQNQQVHEEHAIHRVILMLYDPQLGLCYSMTGAKTSTGDLSTPWGVSVGRRYFLPDCLLACSHEERDPAWLCIRAEGDIVKQIAVMDDIIVLNTALGWLEKVPRFLLHAIQACHLTSPVLICVAMGALLSREYKSLV